MTMNLWKKTAAALMMAAATTAATPALAQPLDGGELYQGEQALYDAARDEGLVVSFDTGPTWANWAAQFKAFKARYPGVEIVYNDLGSAATVVALDKSRNRPQADTAYYFAGSALDAAEKGVVADFKPVNFDRLPEPFRHPAGQWFTIHTLNVAFLVNTKLVKQVPQSWADLLGEAYRNSVVYLDPRTAGQGQVVTIAAAFGNGGSMDDVQPGIDYLGRLHKAGNVLRTVGTTPYAQFVKGEIPIWIGYENDGLKAQICRRHGRRRRGGDPRRGLGRGTLCDQPGQGRPEPECRQALAELHHDRQGPDHLCRGVRATVGAGCEAARRGAGEAARGAADPPGGCRQGA